MDCTLSYCSARLLSSAPRRRQLSTVRSKIVGRCNGDCLQSVAPGAGFARSAAGGRRERGAKVAFGDMRWPGRILAASSSLLLSRADSEGLPGHSARVRAEALTRAGIFF